MGQQVVTLVGEAAPVEQAGQPIRHGQCAQLLLGLGTPGHQHRHGAQHQADIGGHCGGQVDRVGGAETGVLIGKRAQQTPRQREECRRQQAPQQQAAPPHVRKNQRGLRGAGHDAQDDGHQPIGPAHAPRVVLEP
ncbi:hypothetical protein D3C85_1516830 [compost metagenome]